MKVRLLTFHAIDDFVIKHANSRNHFQNWLKKLKNVEWVEPLSIIQTYSSNLIGAERVVFDIGGNGRNAYRMICTYRFGVKFIRLYVNWIGTHEEYNALSNADKLTVWNY